MYLLGGEKEMFLKDGEIKLLKSFIKYDILSTKDIIDKAENESTVIENLRSLVEMGLVERTFKGEHYAEDQYAITGISKEWQKCLPEAFRKVK